MLALRSRVAKLGTGMRSVLGLILSAGLIASAPVVAQNAQGAGVVEDAPSSEELVARYFKSLFAQDYASALREADAFPADVPDANVRALIQAMRAGAMLGLKRNQAAQALIEDVQRASLSEPYAFTTLFEAGVVTSRYDVAADALDTLIARFPDAAREIDEDLVFYLLRNEPPGAEVRNEDRRIALARIGYGGDSPIADWRAYNAIGILLARGDVAGAKDLLRYVDEVEAVEIMLINRRYSALWPALEQSAGDNLATVRASSVASAERAYARSTDDHELLKNLVNSYLSAGQLEDVVAFRTKLPATREDMAKVDEDVGWVVNDVALALHELKRSTEGDNLFALLNDAPMPDGSGRWRVSMIINRVEALVNDGQYEAAAALIAGAEASAARDGSPYARQLVRRLSFSINVSLGRRDLAAKNLKDMLAHATDALAATVEGLLHAGMTDEAESLILRTVADPKLGKPEREDFEKNLVSSLQPVSLSNTDPSLWQKTWSRLRGRPAIMAIYLRLGRDMPSRLLPKKS